MNEDDVMLRMRPLWSGGGCLALVVLAGVLGCRSTEQSSEARAAMAGWQRPVLRETEIVPRPSEPGSGAAAGEPAVEPVVGGQRGPAEFIEAALAKNPAIRAAVARVEAALARIPQATAWPDPILRTLSRPEPIQTAAGDLYFTLGVAQMIPWPARLAHAGDAAAAEARMALEQLNAERIRVIADVERAYWQLYLMDRYIELVGANRRLLEDLEQVVQTRYQVGRVPQQDVLRVQTELAELRNEETRFRLRRAAAAAALNRLMNEPPQGPIDQTVAVETETPGLSPERLIELAAELNPTLAALRAQLSRDRARVEVARTAYWPDVTLGFEWNHLSGRTPFIPPINPNTGMRPVYNRASEAGDDNWGISVQFNIPLWFERIEGAKREARQRLLATQHELVALQNDVAYRIFDAWARVAAQQETLALLRETILPQARQTYEVTLMGYQAGEAGFITLIDNWRRWLDFDLMREREIVDLQTALADLQREVGGQLVRNEAAAGNAAAPADTGDDDE